MVRLATQGRIRKTLVGSIALDIALATEKAEIVGGCVAVPAGPGLGVTINHDKLDNWNPNAVALRDDGEGGDVVAEDRVWTRVIGFPPGTILRYKYSIGLPRDEGRWSRTEEFPLTERGLDVPSDPDIRRVRLQDTFADRPQPTGTAGPSTVITTE